MAVSGDVAPRVSTNTAAAPSSSAHDAWKRLLADLEEAASVLSGPKGSTFPRELAEGYRYLTRVLSGALDMHLERADADRPFVTRMLTPTRKFLGDNPDTDYDYFPITSRQTYRLRGRRGNVTYIGLCLYNEREGGGIEVGGNLADEQLVCADDGSFEIILSEVRPLGAKNWIELLASSRCALVRQYFLDRNREARTEFTIETVDAVSVPAPFDERALAERFAAVGRYVRETVDLSASLSVYASLQTVEEEGKRSGGEVVGGLVQEERLARSRALAETIDPRVILGHMPTPDIVYTGAWWELGDDDAILVEGPCPVARYWSVQIFNRWLESPDYRYFNVAINSAKVVPRADGTFCIVLAHRDPGVANWLATAGLREGQLALRALLCREPLSISFRRVKLSDLV